MLRRYSELLHVETTVYLELHSQQFRQSAKQLGPGSRLQEPREWLRPPAAVAGLAALVLNHEEKVLMNGEIISWPNSSIQAK